MKTCTKCGIEKELTEFHKCSRRGTQSACKKCRNATNVKWNSENKEKKAQWYQDNKKDILEKQKKSTTRKEHMIKYRERKKEDTRKYNKEYHKKNKKTIISKMVVQKRERRNSDVIFRIKCNIQSLFLVKLKTKNVGKRQPFFSYTGLRYSQYIEYFKTTQPEEFNLYLEKGAYHIDHIIPCALYDFTDEEEIKKCWHPHNLRIIPAEENLSKSNKLDLQLVDKYNIRHLLPKGGFNEN